MSRCTRCFGEVPDLAVFCPNCSQPHEPTFAHLLNRVIGERYQIYRRLDKGGLSTVFTAIDLSTDEIVVVKVSDPSHLTKRELTYALDGETARHYWAEMLERMRREAETLTRLRHPNIVQLYDTGTISDELRYVVMEYLRGRTLREELIARQRLPLGAALAIAIELADALREIHSRGIVHRDLNPRNVMLVEGVTPAQPAIKLIDFGIAKFPQPPGAPPFTQHSVLSGTVAYASPEQCQNLPLDQRSDLYSLGVVLYEMVTGARPFNGRTPTEIALKQIQAQPQAPREIVPELPLSLEDTILRALAKDPADRQQNVIELAAELRGIAERVIVALPEKQPEKQVDSLLPLEAMPSDTLAESDAQTEQAQERDLFTYNTTAPKRRGRKAAAAAALALLLTGAVFFARNYRSSRAPITTTSDIAVALPSPSATATANLTGAASPTPSATPTPETLAPAPEAEMAQVMTEPLNRWSNDKESKPIRQSNSGRSIPIIIKPRTPKPATVAQLPAPDLPVFSQSEPGLPPFISQPELAAAPNPENTPSISASIEPVGAPATQTEPSAQIRRPRVTQGSNDDSKSLDRRNAHTNQPYNSADAPRDFSPQLFPWEGEVRGERLIRLEMPGVPGTVDVPRIYRNRVGIVEPPGTENRWRVLVLRIVGSGKVVIRVRWWPSLRRMVSDLR